MSEDLEKADLYLKEAHKDFDFIHSIRGKLDDKIYNMITVSGVLVNVMFGLGYFFIQQQISRTYTFPLLTLSLMLYLATAIIGLAVYRPFDVKAVGAKEIMDEYENIDDKTNVDKKTDLLSVKQALAYTIACDTDLNQNAVDKKAKWFQIMLGVFVAGLLSLVATLASIAF